MLLVVKREYPWAQFVGSAHLGGKCFRQPLYDDILTDRRIHTPWLVGQSYVMVKFVCRNRRQSRYVVATRPHEHDRLSRRSAETGVTVQVLKLCRIGKD